MSIRSCFFSLLFGSSFVFLFTPLPFSFSASFLLFDGVISSPNFFLKKKIFLPHFQRRWQKGGSQQSERRVQGRAARRADGTEWCRCVHKRLKGWNKEWKRTNKHIHTHTHTHTHTRARAHKPFFFSILIFFFFFFFFVLFFAQASRRCSTCLQATARGRARAAFSSMASTATCRCSARCRAMSCRCARVCICMYVQCVHSFRSFNSYPSSLCSFFIELPTGWCAHEEPVGERVSPCVCRAAPAQRHDQRRAFGHCAWGEFFKKGNNSN